MFGKNRSKHPLTKTLFFSLLALISLSCAAFFPQSRALLSSSITPESLPEVSEQKTPISSTDWNGTLDIYTKQVQKIQKSTDTLETQLQALYTEKKALEQSISLKKNLLEVAEKQTEIMKAAHQEDKQSGAMIESLKSEIKIITDDVQVHESQITDIYSQISHYANDMEDLSQTIHMYGKVTQYEQEFQ